MGGEREEVPNKIKVYNCVLVLGGRGRSRACGVNPATIYRFMVPGGSGTPCMVNTSSSGKLSIALPPVG